MNTLTRLRQEMGLSRPRMLLMLGEKPTRLSLFVVEDDAIGVEVMQRAKALRKEYSSWVAHLNARLDEYESRGMLELASSEVQDLLNLRDMHVAQLRHRGTIEAIRGGYEYSFPVATLRDLIEKNSQVFTEGNHYRGPLTYGFLRWLGQKQPVVVDLSKTEAGGGVQ